MLWGIPKSTILTQSFEVTRPTCLHSAFTYGELRKQALRTNKHATCLVFTKYSKIYTIQACVTGMTHALHALTSLAVAGILWIGQQTLCTGAAQL